MKINMIGSFVRNHPFGTEIAFAKGLRELDVEVVTWDPSRQPRLKPIPMIREDFDATIVFKDHGEETYYDLEVARRAGQVVIEYQPDDIRAPGIRGMMEHMREYCDYAFTFDATGARVAEEELGYKRAMKLLVTADPDVYHPIEGIEKDIDFCFVGSLSNPEMHKSRRHMISVLKDAGYDVHVETTFDAKRINLLYNRSKVVLNHATDVGQGFGYGYGYQCRHFEAAMAGTCLLTNALIEDDEDGPQRNAKFKDKDSLLFWADNLSQIDTLCEGISFNQRDEVELYHSPFDRARQIVKFIEDVRDEA